MAGIRLPLPLSLSCLNVARSRRVRYVKNKGGERNKTGERARWDPGRVERPAWYFTWRWNAIQPRPGPWKYKRKNKGQKEEEGKYLNALPTKLSRVFLYFNIYFMPSIDPGRLSPKEILSFSTHFVTVFPVGKRRDVRCVTVVIPPKLLTQICWCCGLSRAFVSLSLFLLLSLCSTVAWVCACVVLEWGWAFPDTHEVSCFLSF